MALLHIPLENITFEDLESLVGSSEDRYFDVKQDFELLKKGNYTFTARK